MQKRIAGAFELGLGVQGGVERLDDALRAAEVAVENACDADRLRRKVVGRNVGAGDLEERHVLGAELDVAARSVDEARKQARAQHRELDRDRLRELQGVGVGVVGPQRRRVRLGEAEPGEYVLDSTAEALQRREGAEHLAPSGEREGNLLEPLARHLLDDIDLARHVAGAERRYGNAAVAALESEALEPADLIVPRSGDPDQVVGALRPERDHGLLGEVAFDVHVADPLGGCRLDY